MIKGKTAYVMLGAALTAMLAFGFAARAKDDSAAELNNEGVKLYQDGEYEKALDTLNKAREADPENLDIQVNIGYALEALGKTDEAVAAYKGVIAADPENIDAHNVLGGAYYNQGDYDKARAEWEFALSLDPDFADAADNLKLLEGLSGSRKGGKMVVSSDLTEAFNQGKAAYRERRFEDSRAVFEAILAQKPQSKYSNYYLGVSAFRLGDEKTAIERIREYLILESSPPENRDVYEFAKAVFSNLTSIGLKRGKSSVDLRAAAFFDAGKKAFSKGDFFDAIHQLNSALTVKPESYFSNYYVALAYMKVQDNNRAAFHFSRCLVSKSADNTAEMRLKVERLLKQIT